MKNKIIGLILSILLVFSFLACAQQENLVEQSVKAAWINSSKDAQWQNMPALSLFKGKKEAADIVIDLSTLKQEIDGFGGCFNEKGWVALSLLSPQEQDEVIKALFDPEQGAKFNICRVAIGASDYGVSRYTLDDVKGDYEMKYFSIERDKIRLIPYIKAAMKYRPELKIWGSVWTVPPWMKTNGAYDGGNMKDDPKVYAAYALYLARFVEEYQKEGINVFAVAVQNEPLIETRYPSCLWTPQQFLVFIRDYMGPLFTKRNVQAEIMLGTMQDRDFRKFPLTVLNDPEANKYVSIAGFQWDGLNSVDQTRERYPEKRIMQTETECGNWHWKPGFDPNRPQNDWAYGSYTWKKIKAFFDAGVNSYMLWNMILDEEGKSIDAERPWPQNAAVVIDKTSKQVIYTPMFYAMKHFSYFVKPGARYVDLSEKDIKAVTFLNPDGELVIAIENGDSESADVNINLGEYWIKTALPPMSWSTIVVPPLR